jgi:hypothetical protein
VTEEEWATCRNPAAIVAYMDSRASARKRRLFPCACVRRVWSQLTDPRSRAAVETAERFADGLATEEELRAAHAAADALVLSFGTSANEAAGAQRDVAHPRCGGSLLAVQHGPLAGGGGRTLRAMRRPWQAGRCDCPLAARKQSKQSG